MGVKKGKVVAQGSRRVYPMSTERERFKSNLMVQVEELVEQALSQGETKLTLTEIEDLVLTAGKGMAQEVTSGRLQQPVSRTRSDLPTCPDCGDRMQPKGKQKRDWRIGSGEVQLQRPYFSCGACGRGYFPPG
jgi:hypothetical protein